MFSFTPNTNTLLQKSNQTIQLGTLAHDSIDIYFPFMVRIPQSYKNNKSVSLSIIVLSDNWGSDSQSRKKISIEESSVFDWGQHFDSCITTSWSNAHQMLHDRHWFCSWLEMWRKRWMTFWEPKFDSSLHCARATNAKRANSDRQCLGIRASSLND